MPAQFAKELRAALEDFNFQTAVDLMDQIRDAEAAGYQLTTREEGLWKRLNRCIDQYVRALRNAE